MIKFSYKAQEYSLISIQKYQAIFRIFVLTESNTITYLDIEYLSEMEIYPEPV